MADGSKHTERPEQEVAGGRATRREILKKGAAGGLVVVYGGAAAKTAAAGVPKFRAKELAGTLRIIQWSHFVPAYDKWFDNIYIKRWGEANDTEVLVDHINQADIPARAAAEVAAQSGHDIFFFLTPPAAYEDQVIDHASIVQEVTKKRGKMKEVALKVDLQPEDEEVLRLLRQLRPGSGATTGPTSGVRWGSSRRPGRTCSRRRRSSRRWAIRSGSACRTRSTRTSR